MAGGQTVMPHVHLTEPSARTVETTVQTRDAVLQDTTHKPRECHVESDSIQLLLDPSPTG
jgi:hypothetical protein